MRKNMKLIGLAVSLTCCAGFIDAQEANEPQERQQQEKHLPRAVSYTHLRAHETRHDLVCRLLLEKKKTKKKCNIGYIGI